MAPQTINLSFDNAVTGVLATEELNKLKEICSAIISSGGLTGVKQGRTIIHFDALGDFMGVELQYWPWRKRKQG